MTYSMDLRERVEKMHRRTGSSAQTASHYHVSESWVRRLIQRKRESGSLEPRSPARPDDQRVYDDHDEQTIRELIEKKPDATLAEVAEHLDKPVGITTVWRTLGRLKLVRKKSRSTPPSKTAPMSRPSGNNGSSRSPAYKSST